LSSASAPPRTTNLHAFARLYGALRWFHPSDAAAALDWDRFAIEGVHRVIDAPDALTLRDRLAELIAPFAPTVHFAIGDEAFPDEPALHPSSAVQQDVVAWEHRGYGDSSYGTSYASKRRHRGRIAPVPGVPFASLWQAKDAAPYRGARVRLSGKLRTANHARGQLWLRIERAKGASFTDEMDDRPVVSSTWRSAEVSGPVDDDATRIVFGVLKVGAGTTWYDDLQMSVQNSEGIWTPIEIRDPSFEADDPLTSWQPGNGREVLTSIKGWNVTADHVQPASGEASLRVEPVTHVLTDELFDDIPRPGETVDIDLGSGLRARVPISLYSRDGQTIDTAPAAARRSQAGPWAAASSDFDMAGAVADVIVVWNVLDHFWPYWDQMSVDWSTELDRAIRATLADHTVDQHVVTLRRLGAVISDGHLRTACVGEADRAQPPFSVDYIEGQVVVTATADASTRVGDIILSVDGRSAIEQLTSEQALTSGSTQWRQFQALGELGTGPAASRLALKIRRGQTVMDVTVPRAGERPKAFAYSPIHRLDDGVYYIDLRRAAMSELNAIADRLAGAPGIVFDMRGRPNGNHDILSYLLTKPDDVKDWIKFPHVIRPDHAADSIPNWDAHGFGSGMLPRQPHIAGRIAFVTGAGAISYAETVMSLVEHYHLGEIVGSATAGTNGNTAEIMTPTGCRVTFTGARVTKLDGSRFHLVGVQPTIPARSTIAGILAGRDEVVEKALAYVRSGAK
jgi:C-terminal processing protease CtpA/Prc